jgi:hypothetical protein
MERALLLWQSWGAPRIHSESSWSTADLLKPR